MRETLPRDNVARAHFFSQIEEMKFRPGKNGQELEGFSKALVDLISSRPENPWWTYDEVEDIVRESLPQPTNDKEARRRDRIIFGEFPTYLYKLSRSGLIVSVNSNGKRWRSNRS